MHRSVFITIIGFALITLLMIVAALGIPRHRIIPTSNSSTIYSTIVANTIITQVDPTNAESTTPPSLTSTAPAVVGEPMSGFFSRVTKKPFGILITPKTSPIQPEKFTGYHTGTDAETTALEINEDIPIRAIASGLVVIAQYVNGYGGVVIIRSRVGEETVSVLYGHLRLSSLKVRIGDTVSLGQHLANLGTGGTSETDGERKHLHLGIIKGTTISYRGYVATSSELAGWEDPVLWLHQHGLNE